MNLDLTRIFVKVVECGSFTQAADLLRIPKSTISKSIARMESESGTKLLVRTTRSLTLTAAGRAFYDSCRGPLQAIEEAQKSLDGSDSMMSGLVRMTAPEDLGGHVIAPAISQLINKHPKLNFEMQYTDTILDLVRDGYDLAVRIGKLHESGLRSKRIGEVSLIPVAAPSYLRSAKKIRTPKDLEDHSCLTLNRGLSEWTLKSESDRVVVRPMPRLLSNQMTSLMKAAIAGAGVALIPSFICIPEIEQGRLERVLPVWTNQGLPVTLLSPLSTHSSARLKLASDCIFTAVRKALSERA